MITWSFGALGATDAHTAGVPGAARPLADRAGDAGLGAALAVPAEVWLVGLGLLVALLLVTWLAVRRAWRRQRRDGLLRPEVIDQRLLGVRACALPPGPARDAVVLRRRLARELAVTRAAVAALPVGTGPAEGLAPVLERLTRAAAAADHRLRAVGSEPTPARQAVALAAARPAVEQVLRSGAVLRDGMVEAQSALDGSVLHELSRDAEEQAAALSLYAQAYRELSGR